MSTTSHGNQTGSVPNSYRRYLEKTYRRELQLVGTPVRIEFRTGKNPYAGKRNKLTQRQVRDPQQLAPIGELSLGTLGFEPGLKHRHPELRVMPAGSGEEGRRHPVKR